MELKQVFIGNLKEIRKAKGMAQMELAEKCNVSSGYISEIEIGRKFPSVETIDKIARALQTEPYRLFIDKTANYGNSSVAKKDITERLIYLKQCTQDTITAITRALDIT